MAPLSSMPAMSAMRAIPSTPHGASWSWRWPLPPEHLGPLTNNVLILQHPARCDHRGHEGRPVHQVRGTPAAT